jgi:hypothetical protein
VEEFLVQLNREFDFPRNEIRDIERPDTAHTARPIETPRDSPRDIPPHMTADMN